MCIFVCIYTYVRTYMHICAGKATYSETNRPMARATAGAGRRICWQSCVSWELRRTSTPAPPWSMPVEPRPKVFGFARIPAGTCWDFEPKQSAFVPDLAKIPWVMIEEKSTHDSRGGFLFQSFRPSFISKISCFPRVFGGFLERRMPGKNGEGTLDWLEQIDQATLSL